MPKGFISPTAGKHYDGLVKSAKDRKRLNEEVFVENSDYARHHIKKDALMKNLLSISAHPVALTMSGMI